MEYGRLTTTTAAAAVCLAALFIGTAVGQSPKDIAVKVGDDARFECTIQTDSQDGLRWTRVGSEGTTKTIYQTYPDNFDYDRNKYTIDRKSLLSADLGVKNVGLDDAGTYRCEPIIEADKGMSAELFVTETPKLRVPRLMEDREAQLMCDITYMGSEKFTPQLRVHLQNMDITNKGNVLDPVKSVPPAVPSYRITFNYTDLMKNSLHEQNFTCSGYLDSPQIEVTSYETLLVESAVRNVQISPRKEEYEEGEAINCTAEGYPEPDIEWIPELSNGARTIADGGQLVLNGDMIGENKWRCRAVNVVGGSTKFIEERITFNVVARKDPPSEPSSVNAGVMAAAIAVPVGVILVVIVVLCIVCSKKRANKKKPSKEAPDRVEGQRSKNQIYKPVSTNPDAPAKTEGQVSFKDEKTVEYTAEEAKPVAAPRQQSVKT